MFDLGPVLKQESIKCFPNHEWVNQFYIIKYTLKNTVISPNFLAWKFCGKAQFLHSFGRFARKYAETVPFHKISMRGN